MWNLRDARGGGQAEQIRPVVNVIVRELTALERHLSGGAEGEEGAAPSARVHRLPGTREAGEDAAGADAGELLEGAEVGSSMRAVAPPVQSFAAGRRR